MGEDKALSDWLGRRAVDRVARLAADLDASVTFSVGRSGYGLPFVADLVPLGGPTGGVLAGMAELSRRRCALAVVLAVDAPTVRAEDLAPLFAAGGSGAAYAGFPLPLVVRPEALARDADDGWPLARLIERSGVQRIACPAAAVSRIRGANTPSERRDLMEALAVYEAAPATPSPRRGRTPATPERN